MHRLLTYIWIFTKDDYQTKVRRSDLVFMTLILVCILSLIIPSVYINKDGFIAGEIFYQLIFGLLISISLLIYISHIYIYVKEKRNK